MEYYKTSILEDLSLIDHYLNTEEDFSKLPLVLIDPKKPGYDKVNGKYFISGAVTCDGVFVRTQTGANTTEYNGYQVFRYEMDENGVVVRDKTGLPVVAEYMYVTKNEGLHLAQFMGSQTAYIRHRESRIKDGNGATKKTIYLQPTPPKDNSFTQDDRVVLVYKTDSEGKRVEPLVFAIDVEKCSPNYLRIIETDKVNKSKNIKVKRSKEDLKRERDLTILSIKEQLQKSHQNKPMNPFKKGGVTFAEIKEDN